MLGEFYMKNQFGIEMAKPSIIAERRNLCLGQPCNYLEKRNDDFYCGQCGCHILTKTELRDSSCPAGYWTNDTSPLDDE